MCYTLVRGPCYQIWWPLGISYQFDLWLTLVDFYMTFDPSNAICSGQGFFLSNMVAIVRFQAIWHLVDPCMTFDFSNALHSGQGFLQPNLVGIGHFLSNLTSGWPQYDLWPQHCIMLWSGFFLTNGCHRAFLSNLTSGWPQLTPAWPLTPAMHYALVRDSSYQIW